jgi:hydrogenase nickel incorporation protein HypB
MFQEADCLISTKLDLAPDLEIDLKRLEANVRSMNPDVTIIALSAKTGEGLEAWLNWVKSQVNAPILLNC